MRKGTKLLLLCILLLSLFTGCIEKGTESTINIAPSVTINANITFGEVPLWINFTANATDPDGYIMNYTWSFGDGNVSHGENPTHIFTEPNTYTVTLTVKDNNGSTAADTILIMAMEPRNKIPTVAITYPPTGTVVSGTVAIQGLASDSDGEVQTVQIKIDDNVWITASGTISWDYGWDTTTVSNGSHFLYARSYDGENYSIIYSVKVTVANLPPNQCPIADISNTYPIQAYTGQQVMFDASASYDPDGVIVRYEWDWTNDGIYDWSGSSNTVIHYYTDDGLYIAKLRVTDDNGAEAIDTIQIEIFNRKPTVNFGYSPSFPTDLDIISFTDSSYDSDGIIVNWTWNFGDGSFAYQQNATHQYANDGTYQVHLTVTDDDGASNATVKQITIHSSAIDNATVYFINVGQGDSILIKTPDGKYMLIDGGKDSCGDDVVSFLENLSVMTIDALVATHPDADHVGGLDEVIYAFNVLSIYHPGYEKETDAYINFITAVNSEGCPIYTDDEVDPGDYINISNTTTFQILHIDKYAPTSNDASIVIKMVYHNVSFMFPGDIASNIENELINSPFDLDSDILKVAHHGSKYSTCDAFLDATTPAVGIISVGTNPYGHPTEETLTRLINHGVEIYRTDYNGTITITTNGETWSVECERTNNAPVASFTYYTDNLTVYFTDTSIDPDGDTLTYNWDFGDGNMSEEQNPIYTYSADGIYNITLMVSDGKTTSITNKQITISGISDAHLYIEYVHYDAAGDDRYNLNDEYVVVKNDGSKSIDMTGYTLEDDSGYWTPYIFPDGFVLEISATVTIHTGFGTDTNTELYWGRNNPIWNNDHDTAYLRDDAGDLVDAWSW